ncbi:unnamed protein product [Prorocentrum cordatum]|uniref:Uncharacterized protein n=1 Tax=Prorocentrum cordatum TaxID=2364126 RepID=A0ABN9RTD2_9DINO|nr:unnamed protein product [Polarella glacialis]
MRGPSGQHLFESELCAGQCETCVTYSALAQKTEDRQPSRRGEEAAATCHAHSEEAAAPGRVHDAARHGQRRAHGARGRISGKAAAPFGRRRARLRRTAAPRRRRRARAQSPCPAGCPHVRDADEGEGSNRL